MRGDLTLYGRVIEHHIPNNRQGDSNEKENKTCYENTAGIVLFCLLELAFTVIGIQLVLRSAHGDKEKHHISEDEPNTDQCALAADIHHAREKRHQDTGDEEGIRKNLDIYRRTIREKAFGPDHEESDQYLNGNADPVIS